MIAVDTNVLVYAHRREAREFEAASQKLRQLAAGSEAWAIPWPCVFEFFSVVTNRRIWKDAVSTQEQARRQLDAWFAAPTLQLLSETEDFSSILLPLLSRPRVCGPVVHDARVAALCLAHGVQVLLTRDRDFSFFPELSTENPFVVQT
jgi:uncharacterized protein